jgi:hypothetical protein
VIDAAAEREEALEAAGDVVLDLLRRHAVEERRDDHDRDVDLREEIHRHAHEAGRAEHEHEQAGDDDEIGITDREAGHG